MKPLLWLSSICLLGMTSLLLSQNTPEVYFNEVRVANAGTDNVEFIELIGPAGTDLTDFQIIHYDGTGGVDGGVWAHTIGAITLPNDGVTSTAGQPIGFYVYGAAAVTNMDESSGWADNHLENSSDGLVLYDDLGNILDAIAWGGTGDLDVDDPGGLVTTGSSAANNYLHVTSLDADDANSLQAPDLVYSDDGSGWLVQTATPGAINTGQTSGDIALPVTLSSFTAAASGQTIRLDWVTQSEINNLGFDVLRQGGSSMEFELLASYQNVESLEGQINSDSPQDYHFSDLFIQPGESYQYKLVDVSIDGVRNEHGPVSATVPITTEEEVDLTPKQFTVYPNFPNPFNPLTHLKFQIDGSEGEQVKVKVHVYDILGHPVKTLLDGERQPGVYVLEWDGTNDFGKVAGGGIYFAQYRFGDFFSRTQKLILSK